MNGPGPQVEAKISKNSVNIAQLALVFLSGVVTMFYYVIVTSYVDRFSRFWYQ